MFVHDGAYGTLLAPHLRGDETVDDLCIRAPAVVVDAHRAYLDAGAASIQTNAFLAFQRGSRRRRDELQRAALACAREAAAAHGPTTTTDGATAATTDGAAAEEALVAATLGPIGSDPREYWRDLELLLDAEVAAVQCETITSRVVADALLAAWADVARGVTATTLRLGCSVSPSLGEPGWGWARELAVDAPIEVLVGLNCSEGPTTTLRAPLEALCELRGTGWAMPSAGLSEGEGADGPVWPFADPARWAEAMRALVDGLPVAGIGGCCGTTPASIAALAST